ncbi:MAG: ankyrin repeat domain-containing protein [Fimbriimonas sp.]|nr:ankyrin repeat domain-containing protein [Fimbriimonas sp.]
MRTLNQLFGWRKQRQRELDAALRDAAKTGPVDLVHKLISSGANVGASLGYELTTLMVAANNGQTDCVRVLIGAGADVHARTSAGETALSLAASTGDAASIEALIDAGADVNSKQKDGVTALIEAASRGNVDSVRTLIAAGADVHARTTEGRNALQKASDRHSRGHVDSVIALIRGGADADTRFEDLTLLMLAANSWEADDVEALIRVGADVNGKTNIGVTALMFAAIGGREANIKALLSAGADVNATTDDGKTSFSFAESDKVALLLKDAGAITEESNPKTSAAPTLVCSGCGKAFKIGDDAVAVAHESVFGLVSQTVVISYGGVPSREDLVDSLNVSPEKLQGAQERSVENWKIIQHSLSRGQRRTWRCHATKSTRIR